jgi:hypothetical protein
MTFLEALGPVSRGGLIAAHFMDRSRAILNTSEDTNFIRTGVPRPDTTVGKVLDVSNCETS